MGIEQGFEILKNSITYTSISGISWVMPILLILVVTILITRNTKKMSFLLFPITLLMTIGFNLRVHILWYVITAVLFGIMAISDDGIMGALRSISKTVTPTRAVKDIFESEKIKREQKAVKRDKSLFGITKFRDSKKEYEDKKAEKERKDRLRGGTPEQIRDEKRRLKPEATAQKMGWSMNAKGEKSIGWISKYINSDVDKELRIIDKKKRQQEAREEKKRIEKRAKHIKMKSPSMLEDWKNRTLGEELKKKELKRTKAQKDEYFNEWLENFKGKEKGKKTSRRVNRILKRR